MPIYNYFCVKCGHTFDVFAKIENRKVQETLPCPSCNEKDSVQQGITTPNIALSIGVSNATRKVLKGSKFEEKLNQIHRETPGSNLDVASTIVDVKK